MRNKDHHKTFPRELQIAELGIVVLTESPEVETAHYTYQQPAYIGKRPESVNVTLQLPSYTLMRSDMYAEQMRVLWNDLPPLLERKMPLIQKAVKASLLDFVRGSSHDDCEAWCGTLFQSLRIRSVVLYPEERY